MIARTTTAAKKIICCSPFVFWITTARLLWKINPNDKYTVVKAINAIESNNRNLFKDILIEPARMGANMRMRGMKHNAIIALGVLFFNLSLYDLMKADERFDFFFINELPFLDRK